MSSDAIRAVTHGLRALLLSQLANGRKVTLLPPGEDPPTGGSGVNLYLYRLAESPSLRNQPWPGDRAGAAPRPEPVLSLSLTYLLTPFGPEPDPDAVDDEAHRALGEAILALHEYPILNRVHIPGFDADTDLPSYIVDSFEDVKVRLAPTSVDELSKIWAVIGKPYRVSVAYEVELVQLVPDTIASRPAPPVTSTGLSVTQLAAPRLTRLTPDSGPLASVVRLDGSGFVFPGQPPVVTVGGVRATVEGTPADRELSVLLPDDLPAGPEVNVQVAVRGRAGTPLRFTVTPWASALVPLRTALDPAQPADAVLTVTGSGLAPASAVTVGGTDLVPAAGSGADRVQVTAPGGIANGVYAVRVRLPDGRLTNPLALEVIPLLADASYDSGTRQLTLNGARLDGTDVRVHVDGRTYVHGPNTDGAAVQHRIALDPGTRTVSVEVDGSMSRPAAVTV